MNKQEDSMKTEEWTDTMEYVTPEMASQWLGMVHPHFQRPVSGAHVRALAQTIRTGVVADGGGWDPELCQIVFAYCEGYGRLLLDGQHRCRAIVLAGVALPVRVRTVSGARGGITSARCREIALRLDLAQNRNLRVRIGLVLAPKDVPNTKFIAALALLAYWWDRDTESAGESGPCRTMPKIRREEHGDAIAYGDLHAEALAVSASAGRSAYDRGGQIAPPRLLAFMHWLFSKASPERADEFVGKLALGAGLDARDPVWLLRERLIRMKIDGNERLYQAIGLSIRAWNAWVRGERPTHLKMPVEGFKSDTFPEPISRIPSVRPLAASRSA